MFHFSVLELMLACGLALLVLVVPLIIKRFYASLDRRLRNIEKLVDKTK